MVSFSWLSCTCSECCASFKTTSPLSIHEPVSSETLQVDKYPSSASPSPSPDTAYEPLLLQEQPNDDFVSSESKSTPTIQESVSPQKMHIDDGAPSTSESPPTNNEPALSTRELLIELDEIDIFNNIPPERSYLQLSQVDQASLDVKIAQIEKLLDKIEPSWSPVLKASDPKTLESIRRTITISRFAAVWKLLKTLFRSLKVLKGLMSIVGHGGNIIPTPTELTYFRMSQVERDNLDEKFARTEKSVDRIEQKVASHSCHIEATIPGISTPIRCAFAIARHATQRRLIDIMEHSWELVCILADPTNIDGVGGNPITVINIIPTERPSLQLGQVDQASLDVENAQVEEYLAKIEEHVSFYTRYEALDPGASTSLLCAIKVSRYAHERKLWNTLLHSVRVLKSLMNSVVDGGNIIPTEQTSLQLSQVIRDILDEQFAEFEKFVEIIEQKVSSQTHHSEPMNPEALTPVECAIKVARHAAERKQLTILRHSVEVLKGLTSDDGVGGNPITENVF